MNEVSHICHGVVIELQSFTEGIKHLIRRVVFLALLQPSVVIGADTS